MCVCACLCLSLCRQNAELAKLRQDCTKLSKELGEKTEQLQVDDHAKRALEVKVSATEKQISALLVSWGPCLSLCLAHTKPSAPVLRQALYLRI